MSGTVSRRAFVGTALIAMVGTAAARFAKAAAAGKLILVIPAKQMKARSDTFVSSFVKDYLNTKAPYPVFTVLYQAGLLPDTPDAMRTVGGCGELVFANNSYSFSKVPSQDMALPYHLLISDQKLKNQVTVAKNLKVGVTQVPANGGLSFTLQPPITVKQLDRLTINGIVAPIPETVLIHSITTDPTGLRYDLSDSTGAHNFVIALDYLSDSGDPKIQFEAAASARPTRNGIMRAIVTAVLCLGMVGCVNNFGPKDPKPTPDPDREVCYNKPAPDGYIRINSKAGGLADCPSTDPTQLNIFVYTNYSNQQSGTKLLVCAEQQVPSGWIDVSGSYHDEKGCDSAKYQGTQFANVRLIYKN